MAAWNQSDPLYTALLDPNLTYQWDKISCMKGAYFAHVVFCYLVFLSGIAAFASRVIPPVKWLHPWFGRAYIIFMLWATGTSLIIHNTGLPPATLVSFIWVLGGMCIAWVVIKFYELIMDKAAFAVVGQVLASGGSEAAATAKDLRGAVGAAKGQLAAGKTFTQRLFSLKALHGVIMFVSWINIAGRIFASDQSGNFTCYTYPAYKPINTKHFDGADQPLTLVPLHDPNFSKTPWARTGLVGWGVALSVGPLLGGALVGAVYSFFAAKHAAKRNRKTSPGGEKLSAVEVGLGNP